jgi:hypothetical protein
MRNEPDDGDFSPAGRKERRLVDVFHQEIETGISDPPKRAPCVQRKRVSTARANDAYPVDGLLGGRAGPAGSEQGDVVAPPGEPAEDLVQVDLGSAGLRVSAVLPVDDEDSRTGYRGFNR